MRAVFDANMLIWLLDDGDLPPPVHSKTKQPVSDCRGRVDHLFQEMSRNKDQLIVPAPALAEALVKIDASKRSAILTMLRQSAVLRVVPFDEVAAAECARMLAARLAKFGRLSDGEAGGRTGIKFDMQIAAIANVHRVNHVYTWDGSLSAVCREEGRNVIAIWDIPLPASTNQQSMFRPQIEGPPVDLAGGELLP